jgi:urea carboxylase
VLLAKAVNYASAGTVEFIYDDDTERVLLPRSETRAAGGAWRDRRGHGLRPRGVDGVAGCGRDAAARILFTIKPQGASIEARVYAEDPANNFQPTPGKLTLVKFPAAEIARVETWIESGATITSVL